MNVDLWVAVGGAAISFFTGFGMMRSKVNDLERRTELAEKQIARQLELIHGLRDVYVSYQHFNEIMSTFRETTRELKDDMKKVLEILSRTS